MQKEVSLDISKGDQIHAVLNIDNSKAEYLIIPLHGETVRVY